MFSLILIVLSRAFQISQAYDSKYKHTVGLNEYCVTGGARKKTKHTYAAVVTKLCLADEDGDYVVMFLIKNGDKGDSFIENETDESPIDYKQVKAILPQPKMIVKGQRVIYKFPCSLNDELK